MPTMNFFTVIIEFGGSEPASEPQGLANHPGRLIRLVESRTGITQDFTLYEETQPTYTLTASETDQLLHLLEQIAVKAPWEPSFGFDGTTYALKLRGPMSEAAFHWWLDVPEGWESVGAVFDYVMGLVDRAS